MVTMIGQKIEMKPVPVVTKITTIGQVKSRPVVVLTDVQKVYPDASESLVIQCNQRYTSDWFSFAQKEIDALTDCAQTFSNLLTNVGIKRIHFSIGEVSKLINDILEKLSSRWFKPNINKLISESADKINQNFDVIDGTDVNICYQHLTHLQQTLSSVIFDLNIASRVVGVWNAKNNENVTFLRMQTLIERLAFANQLEVECQAYKLTLENLLAAVQKYQGMKLKWESFVAKANAGLLTNVDEHEFRLVMN